MPPFGTGGLSRADDADDAVGFEHGVEDEDEARRGRQADQDQSIGVQRVGQLDRWCMM